MEQQLIKNSKQYNSKILTLAIVLSVFFRQYSSLIPGVTLGDVFLILGLMINFVFNVNKNIEIYKNKELFNFWFFGMIISLVSFFIQGNIDNIIITRAIRFTFYVFTIIISSNRFNKNFALKIYKYLCVITSFYIIIQVLTYKLFGVVLPFKILPINWAGNNDYNVEMVANFASKYYYRPSGIFIEPSYAAQFLLPGLAFSLYGWNDKNEMNLGLTILIFIALILSTSSQGILIGVSTVVMYTIIRFRNNKTFVDLLKNIMILLVILTLLTFLFNLDIAKITIDKVSEIYKPGTSGAMRIMRGFAVFKELPTVFKFIGVGHGNLGNYVMTNDIITRYDPSILTESFADYASGASTVLSYYGFFGFILLLKLYWNQLKNTQGPFFLISFIFIMLTFVSTVFFNIVLVFYMSWINIGLDKRVVISNG